MIYGGHFDIDQKIKKEDSLTEEMNRPDFWEDREQAEKVIAQLNDLKKVTEGIKKVKESTKDTKELLDLIEDTDEENLKAITKEMTSLEKEVASLELFLLLSGPYDENNCILEVHSGAGGTEACDWAMMLFRMYNRYCEKKGYKTELLDYQEGEEVGIKSASILVKGSYAYGYLKCERGVHRLVRLSPFDANNKRHTSFASIEVTPEIDKDIDIEIDPKDLKIDVYRSGGAGGQHVNTTDSAVRITHLPTKIVVTCQNERSQLQNRERALTILKGKLKLLELEKQNEEKAKIKGEMSAINFGSQIRSYVLHPYSLIKDARTKVETSNVDKVLDGDLDLFIEAYLKEAGK